MSSGKQKLPRLTKIVVCKATSVWCVGHFELRADCNERERVEFRPGEDYEGAEVPQGRVDVGS